MDHVVVVPARWRQPPIRNVDLGLRELAHQLVCAEAALPLHWLSCRLLDIGGRPIHVSPPYPWSADATIVDGATTQLLLEGCDIGPAARDDILRDPLNLPRFKGLTHLVLPVAEVRKLLTLHAILALAIITQDAAVVWTRRSGCQEHRHLSVWVQSVDLLHQVLDRVGEDVSAMGDLPSLRCQFAAVLVSLVCDEAHLARDLSLQLL